MSNQVDFNKLRKKRQRKLAAKRFLALGIVVAAICGIIIVNRVLVNIGITTQISDFFESHGGSGFPVAVPGGVIREVKSLGDNLAVLNDTNLYLYNEKGKIITNLQQMGGTTVMLPGGDRILTYDVGGKRYSIHSRSKTLLEKESENTLLGAAVNDAGDYALITTSNQYVAQVRVYNKKFNSIYEWSSWEHQVVGVAIAPKGGRMAAARIGTKQGEIYSIISLFDFGVEKELVNIELKGELALEVCYLSDGNFSVVTTKAYHIYSHEGTLVGSYSFDGKQVQAVERNKNQTLIMLDAADGQEVVLLKANASPAARAKSEVKIRDIALGSQSAYLLTDNGIFICGPDLNETGRTEQRGITNIHAVNKRLYYMDKQEIMVLE